MNFSLILFLRIPRVARQSFHILFGAAALRSFRLQQYSNLARLCVPDPEIPTDIVVQKLFWPCFLVGMAVSVLPEPRSFSASLCELNHGRPTFSKHFWGFSEGLCDSGISYESLGVEIKQIKTFNLVRRREWISTLFLFNDSTEEYSHTLVCILKLFSQFL